MKIKLLLAGLFVAGLASALAFAAPTRAGSGTTTGATTTTSSPTTTTSTSETGRHGKRHDDGHKGRRHEGDRPKPMPKPACQNVVLMGSNGSGSVALTVSRASHNGASLVGKQVTLAIPAGARVNALACIDSAGALTLRSVRVQVPKPPPTTTTTTTTGSTTTTVHA